MNNEQINKDPIAFLATFDCGARALIFAVRGFSPDGRHPIAKEDGWKPLYDHQEDGETEALRIANAVIADWQKRYRTLELAALEGDRMIDDLREQLANLEQKP